MRNIQINDLPFPLVWMSSIWLLHYFHLEIPYKFSVRAIFHLFFGIFAPTPARTLHLDIGIGRYVKNIFLPNQTHCICTLLSKSRHIFIPIPIKILNWIPKLSPSLNNNIPTKVNQTLMSKWVSIFTTHRRLDYIVWYSAETLSWFNNFSHPTCHWARAIGPKWPFCV